jgi:hypothetical protein
MPLFSVKTAFRIVPHFGIFLDRLLLDGGRKLREAEEP